MPNKAQDSRRIGLIRCLEAALTLNYDGGRRSRSFEAYTLLPSYVRKVLPSWSSTSLSLTLGPMALTSRELVTTRVPNCSAREV